MIWSEIKAVGEEVACCFFRSDHHDREATDDSCLDCFDDDKEVFNNLFHIHLTLRLVRCPKLYDMLL